MQTFPTLQLSLPSWVPDLLPSQDHRFADDEEKMRLALSLAAENVRRDRGGPFGAAVFNADTGTLIAPGVNMVIPTGWSSAHAEMVAAAIAQQVMQTHDLGGPEMPRCELFTTTEPCTMCLGATLWSGVRRLVCCAADEDARAIGFDEGPKPVHWEQELLQRGIEVKRELLRVEGRKVLRDYAEAGGPIYNARKAHSAT
jgi:tRNA(Arg) A34 adenosine deaminase TadA